MTLTDYRGLLAVQGRVWCRSMWFDGAYIARLPYRALAVLYAACEWGAP